MTDQNKKNSKSNKLIDTSDILFVWRLIVKNIPIILFVPIISYGIGYLYSYRLANIYGAKVQFLLKSNETYDYQDPIYQGLGAYGAYMDVQNQIRIIKSRDLIGEVIDKININTSYFVVGRLKRQEVFETLPFKCAVTILDNNICELPISLVIKDEKSYTLSYEFNNELIELNHSFGEELVTDHYILKLDPMYQYNEPTLVIIKESEYEIVFHSRDYLINKYQSNLTVENIEYTSVLDVSLTDELEQRAKVFLDSLTSTYVDFSKRTQLEINQNTIDNIEKQLDTISIFIQEKESELLSYKDQNSILHIAKEEDEFFSEYVIYTKQKRELQEKKISIIALNEYLSQSPDDRVLPPSFYIEQNDSYLSEGIGKIRSKQINLEIKRTQESEDNLNVINLKKEINLLKNDVRIYLQNLQTAVEEQILVTDKYINSFEKDIKNLPRSAQDMLNIQRELDVNTRMYLFLLEKKTNTLITRAGIIPQVRVLESATKLGVVEPDKNKIKRLFLLGGVILAFFIAVIRKLFFEKIQTLNDLGANTNLNIIGGVPYVKEPVSEVLVISQPKSPVTEAIRTIRTNLSFMVNSEKSGVKIVVSSFFPGEGKTFCSSNIAGLIARGEKRVIVIDLDLHRPKIHKVFNLENKNGVSNFIIGKSTKEEIVHKNVYENLDVITAGPISPNPSELILRKSLSELIKWAEENYDYVIIDTPPFGLLNDTLELIKLVDVFLVIMNTKYCRKKGIQHIEEMLEKFEGVSRGVILNGIRESKIQYYYSKYSYRYTYGYNYGYGYDSTYFTEPD